MGGVLGDGGSLAEPALAHDQQVRTRLEDGHPGHQVVPAELHADHALGVAAHRPDLPLVKADGLALLGGQEDVVLAAGGRHPEQLVALLQVDGDQPVAADVRVLLHAGLLDVALAGCHEHVAGVLVRRLGADGDGGDPLSV